MGQTTTYQLPWPDLGTTADGPAAMQALATATENALKLPRGWYTKRNSTEDVGPATWADIATITVSSAPAGNYLITSVLYWWAGQQDFASMYTWHGIEANSSQVMATVAGGISGPADRPACSVLQQMYTYSGGGSLTVKGRWGFATQGVRCFGNSTISMTRTTDT